MPLILPIKDVPAGELLQHVSRETYRERPLYFGCQGINRYDAPHKNYGVLYLANTLSTALMESIFHAHDWHRRVRRTVVQSEVSQRMVRAVGVLSNLRLADLSASNVMASQFGLNLNQLSSRTYRHTQRVSEEIYNYSKANSGSIDGIIYPSRNNYPAVCIALFDSAETKVTVIDDIKLVNHVDWPQFKVDYKIVVLPA